jgi:hypothetical protein
VSLRETLAGQLVRYDDDAWAALANRGLLRRATKDLEAGRIDLVVENDLALEVEVGQNVVRFDAGGPPTATCTCPSPTVCQHVITAGLWLTGELGAATPVVDLPAELLALDVAALTVYAGRTGYRWARQYVEDLPAEEIRIDVGSRILIALPSPRVTFRYLGGGLVGLVADVTLPTPEKYAVAAVLAYQRASGAELDAIEPTRTRVTEASENRDDSRKRLRVAAARLLTDTVRLGVSHLSPAVHQRYETLAVWAQGAEYHRLALLLRRLADQVELLLARSARADEQALLDEAAIAFALVAALEATPGQGRLVGQARQKYDAVRGIELIGLGGLPWRAASGYRGLTCLFWWPDEQRFLSWTDARPDTMWNFDPRSRWTQPGPWTGLRNPAECPGRLVALIDAQLSASGRLSGVERTRAAVGPLVGDGLDSLPVVDDWTALDSRAVSRRSLLDVPDPLQDWVVLRPASVDAPVFDPHRQALVWPARDATGRPVRLELRWTAETDHATSRIETLTTREFPEGSLLVCRLSSASGEVVAEPLSIVRPGARRPVDVLHFDEAEGKQRKRGKRPSPPAGEPSEPPPPPLPTPLRDLRSWVARQAERGTGATSSGAVLAGLDAHHRALRDVGLGVFPETLPGTDPAVALLRSQYLLLQTSRALT